MRKWVKNSKVSKLGQHNCSVKAPTHLKMVCNFELYKILGSLPRANRFLDSLHYVWSPCNEQLGKQYVGKNGVYCGVYYFNYLGSKA